ncbi:tripartite tricarboxylate transporter substrate binding protein [uncultured Rhodospira sp.]|uniref:Bug family tripartite tricarboxylate transporter substrate binding protein n=1 Tax=uncultured Rhodospira sp. TaxID=1936189 RepID=UPI002609578C|nr:tripartite tricarboxylate transporter substrate binding protein [uncultured Rhodospira sp.]
MNSHHTRILGRAAVLSLAVVIVAMVAVAWTAASARTEWPERPVTLIVPSGAGGGTDLTGRMLAERLEARFGQPFTVINQGQGGGVVGIGAMTGARPDGYTLGILYNFAHYKALGQADFDVDDVTPIAQYNFDPAGFQARADSPWPDLPAALDAIKADPTGVTIGCAGGCGGSWPIAVASLLAAWDIDPARVRMIPSQGANASLQDLAAGGLDVVPCSLPEARAFLDAGLVRALAVFADQRLAAFPDVPTLEEAAGLTLTLGAWRGVVGPADLPEAITRRLEAALRDIVHDPDFRAEMAAHGFGLRWRDAAAFEAFMRAEEQRVHAMIRDLGL